jgi:hypothetical protein
MQAVLQGSDTTLADIAKLQSQIDDYVVDQP